MNNLDLIWKTRLKLRAEGDKLWHEGVKLKPQAEGYRLCAEGCGLWAEGNRLWAEAVIKVHGKIEMECKNWDAEKQDDECHLETGEVFKP